eukprot:IDg19060t1
MSAACHRANRGGCAHLSDAPRRSVWRARSAATRKWRWTQASEAKMFGSQ